MTLPNRETIGPPECPLFYRWTFWAPRWRGRTPFKVMVHRFIPNRQDADVPHDHPRSFLTIVLRGGYEDWVRCPEHTSTGAAVGPDPFYCEHCDNRGVVLSETLTAPAIRFRRADHAHMTRTDDRGAWTLVVMGPEVRPWGFWRYGRWWAFREFEQTFGFAWRCDAPTIQLPGGRR